MFMVAVDFQVITNQKIYRGFKAMKLGVDIADIIEGVDAAFHIVADYWSDLTRPVKSYDQISRFNYL